MQLFLLPHDIFYFAPVGPGILLVWGNVGMHFFTIFGCTTSHINTCFVTFSVFSNSSFYGFNDKKWHNMECICYSNSCVLLFVGYMVFLMS